MYRLRHALVKFGNLSEPIPVRPSSSLHCHVCCITVLMSPFDIDDIVCFMMTLFVPKYRIWNMVPCLQTPLNRIRLWREKIHREEFSEFITFQFFALLQFWTRRESRNIQVFLNDGRTMHFPAPNVSTFCMKAYTYQIEKNWEFGSVVFSAKLFHHTLRGTLESWVPPRVWR